MRTGVAIDSRLMKALKLGMSNIDEPAEKYSCLAATASPIRHQLFDTGANGSLNHRDLDVEQYLTEVYKSNAKITVADDNIMRGCMDGKLNCMVLNTPGYDNHEWQTPFQASTTTVTTPGLSTELLSFDEFYRDGWGVHCRPPDIDGGLCHMYRPKRGDVEAASIPLRYDWDGGGGFYLDSLLKKNVQPSHKAWLAMRAEDIFVANSKHKSDQVKHYDFEETRALVQRMTEDHNSGKDVAELMVGHFDQVMPKARCCNGCKSGCEHDMEISGTKTRLRCKFNDITVEQYASLDNDIHAMIGKQDLKSTWGRKEVTEVTLGQFPHEYEVRGVKASLRSGKQKLTELQFHCLFGHLGFCADCSLLKRELVCVAVANALDVLTSSVIRELRYSVLKNEA